MREPFITIKACRTNAELTQEELADRLNVSVTTIKNWENYSNKPSIDKVVELSRISNIPIDFIILTPKFTETVNKSGE